MIQIYVKKYFFNKYMYKGNMLDVYLRIH